jgi:hypothetical protein
MELLARAKTRETIVHFVNFDQNGLAPFDVDLKNQFDGPVKSVACYRAESDDPASLSFQESGGRVKFTVPAIKTYAMIVVAI